MPAVLLFLIFRLMPENPHRREGLINMRRTMICYGGPRDGETITGEVVPEGYRAFSGSLVVWHTLRIGRLPYWSYGGE